MTDYIWHFMLGMVISIVGSLPLGTVNLGVVQTTVNRNIRAGIYFAVGATLIELIYSSIAVKFLAVFLVRRPEINLIIELISVPVFLILCWLSFKKKEAMREHKPKGKESFIEGVVIGILNPLQIPFWIAYSSYLLSNLWIKNDQALLNIFIIGICSGTLLILVVIAVLSKKYLSMINTGTGYVNKAIGVVFLSLAIYQTAKLSLSFFWLNH